MVAVSRIQPSTQVARMHSGTSEPVTGRLRAVLVGLQVAFTLTLLVDSFTIGSAFLRLVHTDLGFQPSNAVTLKVSLEGPDTKWEAQIWQYYSAVEERLRSIPGVKAVGAVNYLPLSNGVYGGHNTNEVRSKGFGSRAERLDATSGPWAANSFPEAISDLT